MINSSRYLQLLKFGVGQISKLPYIGNASVHLEKDFQSFYRCKLGNKVRLVVIHLTFGIGNRFRYKHKQPLLHRNL